MFFSATFRDALLLQKTIGVIHDLLQDCTASISKKGIFIQSMDSSHVCLVSITWPSGAFASYFCEGDTLVGIHVGNLLRILKCCNKSDTVTLSIEESTSDAMTVSFKDDSRTASFSMKLMTRDDEQMSVPEMEYAASISMDSQDFQGACRDLSIISDTTTISVTSKGLSFSSSGDIGEAHLVYENVERMGTSEISQSFSLRYLNSFAKGTILASKVALKMSSDMPIVIEFVNDVCYISFYLAPKIDDDVADIDVDTSLQEEDD